MYDIQREEGDIYLDHYIYKSRNEHNQIIICEVYRTYSETLNFAFFITTKRKHGYQEGKITGKDGIKSLLWAKKCLLDFIKYGHWKYPGETLVVYPDDAKRRRVYEYALIPLGFQIAKTRDKSLFIKL
jgi:hypothetical protein|nr:MAG TPA: hypothetical protein [Caudoviricetes sp.]